MKTKDFFNKYPTPYGKKGWPDDMKGYVLTFDTMAEWWAACITPKYMTLVMKTMNYAEEIWKWEIMKWGLECRDYEKRLAASMKCCDRIRRKITIAWR